MILTTAARCLIGESVQFDLPQPRMVVDPRANFPRNWRFRCVNQYHGNSTKVTVTRIDDTYPSKDESLDGAFTMRVYDQDTEIVPDFHATYYTYLGVNGEHAPLETTSLFVGPSVTIIKEVAFLDCRRIKTCFMCDSVHTIEESAFADCSDMKVIRLSRNLKWIKDGAFNGCSSLDALFLPPSIIQIDDDAFYACEKIRILSLPLTTSSMPHLGEGILRDCRTFFQTTKIPEYEFDEYEIDNFIEEVINNNDLVNHSIIKFYKNLPPLNRTCLDVNVTARSIIDCIHENGRSPVSSRDHGGMTPLHILAMNPNADTGSILACANFNVDMVITRDNRGKTPLDYLIDYGNIDGLTSLVTILCMHRDIIMEWEFDTPMFCIING